MYYVGRQHSLLTSALVSIIVISSSWQRGSNGWRGAGRWVIDMTYVHRHGHVCRRMDV